MAPVKRVNPLAHAVNFGRSASGSPSSSQITESGSFRANRLTRSAGLPSANNASASSSAMARMCFHGEDSPTAKGFVDDVSQPSVIRFVH